MAHFEIFRQGKRVGRVDWAGQELAVGRDDSSAIKLADPLVSRMHARIFPEKGRLVLEDLKTSNGSFVNGRREYRRPLSDRDRIELGAYVVVCSIGEDEQFEDVMDPFAAALAQSVDEDGEEQTAATSGRTEVIGPGKLASMRREAEMRLKPHLELAGASQPPFELKHAISIVGSGDRCQIRIPTMKRAEAARFERLPDGSFKIRRLGWFSRMTIEGDAVRTAVLKGNEKIEVGGVTLVFRRGKKK